MSSQAERSGKEGIVRLEDYPFRMTDNVRYGDLDPNRHVNNAVYATYFETSRVTLLRSGDRGLMPRGFSWMLVHLAIDFRAEMHWPGSFELGIGLKKIGRTSTTFHQVVFAGGVCTASADAITVFVDESTRKPAPLSPDILDRLRPFMLPATLHIPQKGVSPEPHRPEN